jgi:hypothetical protein
MSLFYNFTKRTYCNRQLLLITVISRNVLPYALLSSSRLCFQAFMIFVALLVPHGAYRLWKFARNEQYQRSNSLIRAWLQLTSAYCNQAKCDVDVLIYEICHLGINEIFLNCLDQYPWTNSTKCQHGIDVHAYITPCMGVRWLYNTMHNASA